MSNNISQIIKNYELRGIRNHKWEIIRNYEDLRRIRNYKELGIRRN